MKFIIQERKTDRTFVNINEFENNFQKVTATMLLMPIIF